MTYEYCGRNEMEENESQQRGWKAHDTTNSPKNIRLTSMEYFSQRRLRRVTVGDRIPAAFNVDTWVMFVLAMAAVVAGTDGRQLPLLPTAAAAALNEALREMRAIFFRWFSWRDVESSVDEIDFIDVVEKCRLLSSDLAISFSRCSCCSRWSGSRSAAASYAS